MPAQSKEWLESGAVREHDGGMKGLALVLLAAVDVTYRADTSFLFEDQFKGKLGPGWSWVRENPKGWRVTPNGLEIRVEPGNMWGKSNDAKNILVRDAPDGSAGAVEAMVTFENRPKEQYEQIDFVWYYDDGHMVKLGQELVDGYLTVVMGREEKERAETISVIPLDTFKVAMRFLVKGKRIRGQFLPDGAKEWRDAGECDLPVKGTPKISIQAYMGPAKEERWARVTEFRVAQGK